MLSQRLAKQVLNAKPLAHITAVQTRSYQTKHNQNNMNMITSATNRQFQRINIATTSNSKNQSRELFNQMNSKQRLQMQMIQQCNIRHFSGGPDKKKEDYDSAFDNLMEEGKITQEESDKFKERREKVADEHLEEKEKLHKIQEEKSQEGEQKFDDFLDGKEPQGGQDMKSVFQSFYTKVKEQDRKLKSKIKSMDQKEGFTLNSAKASLGGFSDKLEKRRQAFKEARMKKEEQATEDATAESQGDQKDNADATQNKEQQQQQQEHQANDREEWAKKEQERQAKQQEQQKAESKDEKQDAGADTPHEKPVETVTVEEQAKREKAFEEARKLRLKRKAEGGTSEPGSAEPEKETMYSKNKQKLDGYFEKIEEKYPKMAQRITLFKEVWDETFPTADKEMRKKQERRRNLAKIQREEDERMQALTPEEIEEMEKSIPEWKRNALVTTEQAIVEEKLSMYNRMKQQAQSKFDDTEFAEQYYESEEYKKLQETRQSYSEFKDTLKDEVEMSQDPKVQAAAQAVDYAFIESSCAKAIMSMELYDPDFDLHELEKEAGEIFREFYCNFLAGNIEFLEIVSGGTALALSKAHVKLRATDGAIYMFEEPFDCSEATFQSGEITTAPGFTFIVTTQEIDCKVSIKDETKVMEGSVDNLMQNSWRFTLTRHAEPDLELTGHYWQVTEFAKVGELKQLV